MALSISSNINLQFFLEGKVSQIETMKFIVSIFSKTKREQDFFKGLFVKMRRTMSNSNFMPSN